MTWAMQAPRQELHVSGAEPPAVCVIFISITSRADVDCPGKLATLRWTAADMANRTSFPCLLRPWPCYLLISHERDANKRSRSRVVRRIFFYLEHFKRFRRKKRISSNPGLHFFLKGFLVCVYVASAKAGSSERINHMRGAHYINKLILQF